MNTDHLIESKKQVELIPNEKFGSGYWDIAYASPRFSFEDIQKFLITLGYTPMVYEFICIEDECYYDSNDSRQYTGRKLKLLQEKLIAVKPDVEIPREWSKEVHENFEIISVFKKELKKKILGF